MSRFVRFGGSVALLAAVAILAAVALLVAGCASVDPASRWENRAVMKRTGANNHIFDFTARKAVDGEALTYWEGAADSYPNELTVDLGESMQIHAIRVRLNPRRIWQAREQTYVVLVSEDGELFDELVAEAAHVFDPEANGNTVTTFTDAEARYIRLVFSANTEATGGQVAELEVYAD